MRQFIVKHLRTWSDGSYFLAVMGCLLVLLSAFLVAFLCFAILLGLWTVFVAHPIITGIFVIAGIRVIIWTAGIIKEACSPARNHERV